MARLGKNSIGHGLSGPVGDLVYRTYGGETYVSGKPTFTKKSKKGSPLQTFNRDRFRDAQAYAGEAMRDPVKKAYYLKMAKKLNLPNARTAAVTEYMRHTLVEKVDTRKFTGKAGELIPIIARKKDFNNIEAVEVKLHDANGQVIEKGSANKKSTVDWVYRTSVTNPDCKKITVNIKDRTGQEDVFTCLGALGIGN